MRQVSLTLGFLFSAIASAFSPIEDLNFSELISSSIPIDSSIDAKTLEDALWQKYLGVAANDNERKTEHENRVLMGEAHKMRFSFSKKGEKGPNGYPVYIALHGGGGGESHVDDSPYRAINDGQWRHMQIYYEGSVKDGIYVAPRGITDTWDLHNRPESYGFYDRLIENLIAYEDADPNRIYLLGFSAGGDGVYQITPRMADRFAAANMSAGHHNWIRFDNLLNTPFLIQVGEYDGSFNRNRVAVENYIQLSALQSAHQGYIHDVFVHPNSGHNGWYDNDASFSLHYIIQNPVRWLNERDRSVISVNTNAVSWLNRFERSLPKKLIWDLGTRAPRGNGNGSRYVEEHQLRALENVFYWLAIDDNIREGRIQAEVDVEANAIFIHEAQGVTNFRIRLNNRLLDFNRPIKVYYQGNLIFEQVNPQIDLSVLAQSLLERGDRFQIYHSELKIEL